MMAWDTTSIMDALYGGLLIGLAVSILLVFNGRIAGISGILGQALSTSSRGQGWRYAFLIGLFLSPIIYGFLWIVPNTFMAANNPIIIVAGLLVGIGTQLGSGCTSGHGVCGIARLSKRSVIATVTFMCFGMLTVFIIRHVV